MAAYDDALAAGLLFRGGEVRSRKKRVLVGYFDLVPMDQKIQHSARERMSGRS